MTGWSMFAGAAVAVSSRRRRQQKEDTTNDDWEEGYARVQPNYFGEPRLWMPAFA